MLCVGVVVAVVVLSVCDRLSMSYVCHYFKTQRMYKLASFCRVLISRATYCETKAIRIVKKSTSGKVEARFNSAGACKRKESGTISKSAHLGIVNVH